MLSFYMIPDEYKAADPNFKTKYQEQNAPPVLETEENKESKNVANNYVNSKPDYISVTNLQTNIFNNKKKNNAVLNQNATKRNYLPLWEFEGHERDLIEKLNALHGGDFEFSTNINPLDPDNDITITRKSDGESINIKLEDLAGYTEKGEASQTKGYSQYINFVYGGSEGLKLATEQYTELALKYKDARETWSEFYERTNPKPGTISYDKLDPQKYKEDGRSSYEYEEINIGSKLSPVYVRKFTDGHFEYGGSKAIGAEGELSKVTEEDKKIYQQLLLINRVNHKRKSIAANASSAKYAKMAIDDPVRLINIMYNKEQAGTAIRNDEGNIIELTKENENYYTLENEKFKNEELLSDFSEYYLNDSGAVEFQQEYSEALESEYKKLPNYDEEVEKIKNKYNLDEQYKKISDPLIEEAKARTQEDYDRLWSEQSDILSKEIQNGEHGNLNTEQLTDLLSKRVDALMNYEKRDNDLNNAIHKQMEPYMDPFNKELASTLDSMLPKEFKE